LPPRIRCRIYETALHLKAGLPRRKGTQGVVKATDIVVLHALLFEFANGRTGLCTPSVATIAARTGLSESSVGRSLLTWRAIGLVTPHPRYAVYQLGDGYSPECRRNRGTEIRVETSYSFTFPGDAALDDLTQHTARIMRRLADLGRRGGFRRGRQFDGLTTPPMEGSKQSRTETPAERQARRQAVIENWCATQRRVRGDFANGESAEDEEALRGQAAGLAALGPDVRAAAAARLAEASASAKARAAQEEENRRAAAGRGPKPIGETLSQPQAHQSKAALQPHAAPEPQRAAQPPARRPDPSLFDPRKDGWAPSSELARLVEERQRRRSAEHEARLRASPRGRA
jgi:hypothetical protein